MNSFQWIDAKSVEEAVALLSEGARGTTFAKAGGMDLLDLMKEGIIAPARIVNLQRIDALRGVQFAAGTGLRLGALTTLAEIASHSSIRQHYPALAAAAAHAATPQVRNAATIGGNLLQRPRCWYFRNELFHAAREEVGREQSQYGAIFDNAKTTMVHASTPATALLAYGASVHVDRQVRPVARDRAERFPAAAGFRSRPRHDARQRRSADACQRAAGWRPTPAPRITSRPSATVTTGRSVDVAVVLTLANRKVEAAKIVAGAVAPVPRRMTASESALVGREIDERVAAEAGRAAVRGATPTEKNSYKVPVLEAVIQKDDPSRDGLAAARAGTTAP